MQSSLFPAGWCVHRRSQTAAGHELVSETQQVTLETHTISVHACPHLATPVSPPQCRWTRSRPTASPSPASSWSSVGFWLESGQCGRWTTGDSPSLLQASYGDDCGGGRPPLPDDTGNEKTPHLFTQIQTWGGRVWYATGGVAVPRPLHILNTRAR